MGVFLTSAYLLLMLRVDCFSDEESYVVTVRGLYGNCCELTGIGKWG